MAQEAHSERSHKDIWKKEEKEEPKPKKDWTKWAVRTLGILFILLAVLAGLMLFQVNKAQIVLNIANLRLPLDTVEKSNLVSLTDDEVAKLRNPRVTESWDRILSCMDAGCKDSLYFGMIYTLALETDIPHRTLIRDLIVTQRYWGTNESILEFSRAVADVDHRIQQLRSPKVTKDWDKIVACDGTCKEKNDLYFTMIKDVVKLGE